jgi:hypothetical protein
MTAIEPLHDDDPVLRRVTAARPRFAADDLSPHGRRAAAIAARVLASDRHDDAHPVSIAERRRLWLTGRAPGVAAAVGGVAAVSAVVLAAVGVFAGTSRPGVRPPTAAATVQQTVKAMSVHKGTIVVEHEVFSQSHHPTDHATQITETPAGPGAQDTLRTDTEPHLPAGMAVTGGDQSVYERKTHTIYVTSIWGPYLHPGTKPGTSVYDPTAKGAPTYGHSPLTVTAQQATLLREGVDQIRVGPKGVGLRVTPVFHYPSDLKTFRTLVADHAFQLVGRKTLDGRKVIEFSGGPWRPAQVRLHGKDPHDVGGETLYLNANTHLPYKDVVTRDGQTNATTYTEFERLPITAANERLLSLRSQFPMAKVVRSHAGYLHAAGRTSDYTGQ